MQTTIRTDSVTVKITANDKGNPPGKLADAELHFADGPLAGLKLIGGSSNATYLRVQHAGLLTRGADVRLWASSRGVRPYDVRRSRRTTRYGVMSRTSRSPSLLRVIAWTCLGPFAALGGLVLLVFGFGALAVGVRLVLALFGHGGP